MDPGVGTGRTNPGRVPLHVLFVHMFRVIDPSYRDQLRAKVRKLSPRLQEVAMSIADLLHDEGFAKGRITTLRH
jgi:hypothetical protein